MTRSLVSHVWAGCVLALLVIHTAAAVALSHEYHSIEEVVNKMYSVIHKQPAQIAVASQCGGGFYRCSKGAFTKSYANHRAYAQKHGYEYFLIETPLSGRFQPWDRYPFISHLHNRGATWVLFIEADSLIMNNKQTIEDFVQKHGLGKDLISSGDYLDHYLAGNFLMKKSPWTHSVMCKAWKVCPSPGFDQLGAMMTILGGGDPHNHQTWKGSYDKVWGSGVAQDEQLAEMQRLPREMGEHLALLPQRAMNSYPSSARNGAGYVAGDWMVHFAGLRNKGELVAWYSAPQANQTGPEVTGRGSFLQTRRARQSTARITAGTSHSSSSCDVRVRLSGFDCSTV